MIQTLTASAEIKKNKHEELWTLFPTEGEIIEVSASWRVSVTLWSPLNTVVVLLIKTIITKQQDERERKEIWLCT